MNIRQLLRRIQWLVPATAAAIALLIVFLRLRLWTYDLKVPLSYAGDALQFQVLVKALREGLWNYHISRLAAPFGMDAVDFPIGCTLDFAVMRILLFAFRNPFVVVNAYWLLSVAAAAAFAALFLRWLGLSKVVSSAFGALFAVIPSAFFRLPHVNLVQHLVPLGVFLACELALDKPDTAGSTDNWKASRGRWLFGAVGSAAIGLSYIYWAFFTCCAIALGAVIGWFRNRRSSTVARASAYVLIIIGFSTLNISASLIYWWQNGRNPELAYKHAAETDYYGLRIRQMVTPIIFHPIPLLHRLQEKIAAPGFYGFGTEADWAALGTIGSIGLLLLLLVAICRPASGYLADHRLTIAASIALGLILIAQVGGFGSLFAALVSPDIRSYGRISPYIALLSLSAVALTLDTLLGRRSEAQRAAVMVPLLIFAAYDQVPVQIFSRHHAEEGQFRNDAAFIRVVEKTMPAGTMVFQLPHTEFPLDGGKLRMYVYDHARAYLQSRTMRWSWGNIMGRHGNWDKQVAERPVSEFVDTIVAAGFRGVLLDRFGYPDQTTENQLATKLQSTGLTDATQRWVFFDLRTSAAQLTSALSPGQLQQRQEAARHPIEPVWGGKFSTLERNGTSTFRWCGVEGRLTLTNTATIPRRVALNYSLQQFDTPPKSVVVDSGAGSQAIPLGTERRPCTTTVLLPSRTQVTVRFDYQGPKLQPPPGENRELAFQLLDFSWREVFD